MARTLKEFVLDMIFLINPIDLKNLFKGLILNIVFFFEHTLGIFNIGHPFFIILKASLPAKGFNHFANNDIPPFNLYVHHFQVILSLSRVVAKDKVRDYL